MSESWEAKFYQNGPVWGWDIIVAGTNKLIARIAGGLIWEDGPNPKDEANARLIATSPDLLKVCRTILTIFHLEGLTISSQFPLSENSQRLKAVMGDMRVHVAKATGEATDADTG